MTTETPTAGTNNPDTGTAPTTEATTLLTSASATPSEAAPATQPTQAEKPTEATGDKPAEEAKPQGAPEEYAEFVAPEGVTLDTDTLSEFKEFAKEKGLSQEEAQKLVDLGAKNAQMREQAFAKQIEQAQAQWADSSRTDKEFGGDKISENMAVAKQALDTFGTPELSAMLRDSGLGNHPEIIRAFYRVGKAISEDRLVSGTKAPTAADPAKRMFPKMN